LDPLMLSKADDYPIHQTPEPIAYAGSDRNFYDRYFFNGYSADGELYFAAALGVYPHLDIMDAAFGVRIGDVQYNLRASRHLYMERMDTQVGPIRVEVLEPLERLRIAIDDNAHGITADIVFEGRSPPIEEPRVTRRHGPRMVMDFTRLTQLGRYSGWVRVGGREVRFDGRQVQGVRDRSWGVRTIGLRDPQPMLPVQPPQFHWFWVPAHFQDRGILFLVNEDANGDAWHKSMVVAHDDGRVEHVDGSTIDVVYQPGTRWPVSGSITAGDGLRIDLKPGPKFFMTGIGYLDPEWSHGIDKGPLAIGYDEIRTNDITTFKPPFIYAQAFAHATMTLQDGAVQQGLCSFESLSMGPHRTHGFTAFADGAAG
jgi:hypothetical protein